MRHDARHAQAIFGRLSEGASNLVGGTIDARGTEGRSCLLVLKQGPNGPTGLAYGRHLIHNVIMTAEASPEVGSIASLGPNGAKARFGAAYLRAICSHAGVGFTETSIDEDVLAIDGKIEFAVGDARVQLKCTGQFRINGGETASWPAEEEWWTKWHKSKIPVYFIIIMVDPDDQCRWLDHLEDATLCRAVAFWVRVDRMAKSQSVTVPKSQRLTADTLSEWAADVDASFGPAGVGARSAS